MTTRGDRWHSIDWVRGIVMVLMALDHVRDYYGELRNPTDLETTTTALFFTRWITHLCAPTFVFLAGTSAWLYGSRGRSRKELSLFLLSRGLWLLVLELTLVNFSWINVLGTELLFFQVISAIAVSMIVLAGLVFLPLFAILAFGLVTVLGHNALDAVTLEDAGAYRTWWRFLHVGIQGDFGFEEVLGARVLVIYPIIPWIGVMALGYCIGPLSRLDRPRRRRVFLGLGVAVTLAFLVLRGIDAYGDPTPHDGSFLSFLNCRKYPPSLAFLLMTLGPALALVGLLDVEPGRAGRALTVYGRVPLFYYVAHLFLAHDSSRVVYWLTLGEPVSVIRAQFSFLPDAGFAPLPEGFQGFALGWVYVAWIAIVLVLYPACAWYDRLKQRSRSRLLSYL
jgi:uncharacterized membrane protein